MSKSLLVGIPCVVMAFVGSAQAQTAAPANEQQGDGIQEITVTARRVSERLQSTPVAVTAVTSAAIDKAQVTNIDQLQRLAPGLVIQPTTSQAGSASLSMRGQSSTDALLANDQAIGVYLDGVYMARSSGALFNLVDTERVEVLRGPQGTLFGRNTTGGAINLIAKKPTGNLEGMVRLRYGNFDTREAVGVLNVPLIGDQLAVRAVYQHSQYDGYGRDGISGNRIGGDNTDLVRASLLIAPSDQPFHVLIQADYTDRRTGGEIVGLKSFTPNATLNALIALCSGPSADPRCPVKTPAGDSLARYATDVIGKGNFYTSYSYTPSQFGNAKSGGVSGTLDYALGQDINLKSITAYRGVKTASLNPFAGSPYLLTGPLLAPVEGNFIRQRQFSEELQLTGKVFADKLDWIVGAFYFTEHGYDHSRSRSLYPLSTALNYLDANVRNKSYAGYGQATYHITDAIRITGGLRYTEDHREAVRFNRSERPAASGTFVCTLVPATIDAGTTCQATNTATFDYLSYTAGVDWQINRNAFVYAKTSRAYRSGGFNTRAVLGGLAAGFGPERVTDYEVGAKLDLLDRKLRFNVAAYMSQYNDIQRGIPILTPGSLVLASGTQNAAKGKIHGVEAELTVLPFRGFQLGVSSSYLHTKYTDFTILTSATTSTDVSATPFPFAPKFSYSIDADYTVPIGAVELNLHADYSHRTSTFTQTFPYIGPGLFGATHPDVGRIAGYGLLNGQVALALLDKKLEVAFYSRNILQKKYYSRLLSLEDTALGTTSYLPGEPRTYGVRTTYKF
ncbi:iron complex outermembrane recepter protein [Sphingomonas sp. YR710]|uniref:TonB-dependent receptor n=1 Tax=Sphingomonas sp. YR710 TaxID=1882773 RepID=UPI000883C569|nr:TonB-dependent receptor [Sphingomonas sp. YR710]SDC94027.1 iron complex outermembrane recepter protein [Sphingomonas sp. YR710]